VSTTFQNFCGVVLIENKEVVTITKEVELILKQYGNSKILHSDTVFIRDLGYPGFWKLSFLKSIKLPFLN